MTFGYDGPLVTSEQWSGALPGGVTKAVSHGYNQELRDSTQTVTGTSEVISTYDFDGLLIGAGPLLIHRRPDNGLLDSTYVQSGGGSLTSSQDYDTTGDLRNLRYRHSAARVFFQQSLKRDALGRVTEIAEQSFGVSRTLKYRYDLAGRLYGVKENNDTVATYRYDANGNRQYTTRWSGGVLMATDTAQYDAQDRMTRYAGTTYTYTAAGSCGRKPLVGSPRRTATTLWGNLNAVGSAARTR